MNAMGKEAVDNGKLSALIFNEFKIDTKTDSKKVQASKYAAMYSAIQLNDPNFIRTNMINLIRTLSYKFIRGESITDSKYGFWKSDKGNGELIELEDQLIGSTRTGKPEDDFKKISGEPALEAKILMLSENYAADIPKNQTLEVWATLDGATGWINERVKLIKEALDIHTSTYLKNLINTYAGYTPVLINDKDLTKEQKATALQRALGKVISFTTTDYRKIYNEEANTGKKDNFTYKLDTQEIGLLFSTDSIINNEIDYLRRLFKNAGDGSDYAKDWNVGTIQVQDLADDVEVVFLPKGKMYWGAQYGTGTTPFWYSYFELITEWVFYGAVFFKALPALTFSFGTPEDLKVRIKKDMKAFKEAIEEQIASISAMTKSNTLNVKEFPRKKADALKFLNEQLTYLNENEAEFIQNKLDNAVVYDGKDLADGKDEDKQFEKLATMMANALNIKVEDVLKAVKEQSEKIEKKDTEDKK